MIQTIYSTNYASLHLDPSIPALYEEWMGTVSIEEFQHILETKLELYNQLRENSPSLKWMVDIRNLRTTDEAKGWGNAVFHQQLFLNGVREIAFVVPEETYYELPDEFYTGKMDSRKEVELCYFESLEEAGEWLKKKVETPSITV